MENKLYVSMSPHIHGGDSISRKMWDVIIALIPALLVSLYFFGLGSLLVTSVSIASCVLFEYLIARFLLKQESTLRDGSAILTGLLLAFNLPSNLPLWIVVIGAMAANRIGSEVSSFIHPRAAAATIEILPSTRTMFLNEDSSFFISFLPPQNV
jgi:electron transport complex protein RnfD